MRDPDEKIIVVDLSPTTFNELERKLPAEARWFDTLTVKDNLTFLNLDGKRIIFTRRKKKGII